MLEKVKQVIAAFLATVEAKGEDEIDCIDLQHEYARADEEGATMLSMLIKVDFKIEGKEETAKPQYDLKDGEVH